MTQEIFRCGENREGERRKKFTNYIYPPYIALFIRGGWGETPSPPRLPPHGFFLPLTQNTPPPDAPLIPPMAGARSDHNSCPAMICLAKFSALPTYSDVTPSFHLAGSSLDPMASAILRKSPSLSLYNFSGG